MKNYEIIYADPAWHFTTWSRKAWRSVYHKYSTATVAEMAEIPVESIAADNSMLFMWVTDPCLPQAFELGAAWGFTYKTVAFTPVKAPVISQEWDTTPELIPRCAYSLPVESLLKDAPNP